MVVGDLPPIRLIVLFIGTTTVRRHVDRLESIVLLLLYFIYTYNEDSNADKSLQRSTLSKRLLSEIEQVLNLYLAYYSTAS